MLRMIEVWIKYNYVIVIDWLTSALGIGWLLVCMTRHEVYIIQYNNNSKQHKVVVKLKLQKYF